MLLSFVLSDYMTHPVFKPAINILKYLKYVN